jgi:carbon monoxide dehydrogenase subunit G
MRLEHRFRVPAGPDETWALLLDARALSSAVPGLRLDEILADEVAGSVRIDVGDRCVTYRGEAAFVEKDPADRHLVVEAAGRESEHGRAASATLAVALEPDGDTTTVVLQADLDVEGGAPDADRATVYAAVQRVVDSLAGEVTQRLRHPEPAPWTEDPVHECRPRAHAGVGAAGAGSPPVAADLPAADPLTAAAVTAADPVAADPLVADPVAAADPVVPVDLPAPAGPVNPVDRPAPAAWPVARSLHRRPGSVPPALWLVGLLVLVAMVAWLLRRLRD